MMGSAPMMKRNKLAIGAGVMAFFVMFSAGVARADEPAPPDKTAAERAKQHFALGEGYFKSRKFDEALVEYQRGYADKPSPVFTFNMAQCQRLLGHRGEAIDLYRRYLAEAPEGVGRAVAEQRIAELTADGRSEEAPPTSPPAPPLSPPVQATAPAVEPLAPAAAAETTPAPGPDATKPGLVPAQTETAAAPAAQTVPAQKLFAPAPIPQTFATVTATAPAAEPRENDGPIYRKWWFWVAAAAVASGTVVAIAAASSSSRPACDPDRLCK